ncbi:glucose sorbosone dehydrogenase [Cohnella faecalis]|uniref:Glucose sorbosone dehydrogenase n=3 Tax=Cohnella faecalis TaxID=2315694 RepID=A0A398CV61_9BACL|nr:glucose sorbosone dehydrogenase [Cohnella faecalis]
MTVMLLLGAMAIWTGCRDDKGDVPSEPLDSAIEQALPAVTLEEVAPKGAFDNPVGMTIDGGLSAGLANKAFVVEQPGRIRMLDLKQPDKTPETVLDLTDRVYADGNEQGLLGLAFDPKRPGVAYVNYTTKNATVISRFATADPEHPERLDPESELVLLTYEQPFSNHKGGQLAFGPEGYLYIASGDGGSGGDPYGNAQNTNSLLGKILRIDVLSGGAYGRSYGIPSDNPFANGGGAPEVYAYGLRNPWRFSFDAATGKLWAADVGQDRLEEIDVIEKGGNYGWNAMEASKCYEPASGCVKDGLILPIYEYGRELGVSITGGYVYRGKQLSEWIGWYIYADYATGTIWALRQRDDGTVDNRTLLQSGERITSFGVDADGELYICSQDGSLLRIAKRQQA